MESNVIQWPAPGCWVSSDGGLLFCVVGVVFGEGDVISLWHCLCIKRCLSQSDRCRRIKHIKSLCKRGNDPPHGLKRWCPGFSKEHKPSTCWCWQGTGKWRRGEATGGSGRSKGELLMLWAGIIQKGAIFLIPSSVDYGDWIRFLRPITNQIV